MKDKKGGRMSGIRILKFLINWLFVICFLVGNIGYACASSDPLIDSGSYQNKTENSGVPQLPDYSEGNSAEDSTPSATPLEEKEIKAPENNSTENKGQGKISSETPNVQDSKGITDIDSKNTQVDKRKTAEPEKPVSKKQLPLKKAPPSASVNLHGEKTEVISGEDILLKLSAVNLITKPVMHVQVIIIPPSGMSVSSSEFVQSGAGQYTTTYELEPGQGRDIEVRIETNQPGNFTVQGRVVYYYGKNTKNVEDYTLELPITVKDKTDFYLEQVPGFKFASLIFTLIAVFVVRRIKWL